MSELNEHLPQLRKPGCVATVAALVALPVIAPAAAVLHRWKAWRRGSDVRVEIGVEDSAGSNFSTIEATWDVPRLLEPGFRRNLTDIVIRVAEAIRRPDDVYNVVYRLPADPEAVVLPVGPQVQALGERLFLVFNQGNLEGRTVLWLTLARDDRLSQVIDPSGYDAEADGEPGRLLAHPSNRWAMASEWANIGPSLVIRIILVVPTDRASQVQELLNTLR